MTVATREYPEGQIDTEEPGQCIAGLTDRIRCQKIVALGRSSVSTEV